MLCLKTVQALLDRDEDSVLSLIEMGLIRWAFDLAAPGADRRMLYVYRGSLLDYGHGRHLQADYYRLDEQKIWPEVFKEILGGSDAHLSIRRLANRFTCSSTHLYRLVEAGCLQPLSPQWRRGPLGGALITRASIEQFLRARRLGAVPNLQPA